MGRSAVAALFCCGYLLFEVPADRCAPDVREPELDASFSAAPLPP